MPLTLTTSVKYMKGVGPRRAESLARLGVRTVGDLLYHTPHRYLDATSVTPLARAVVGREVTCVGRVISTGVIPTRRGLRVFSWFIYRIMTPGLHNIFMNPSNHLQLRDALLSVLAGNIFLRARLAIRLLALKALYYLYSMADPRPSWAAWKRRDQATRESGAEPTAT